MSSRTSIRLPSKLPNSSLAPAGNSTTATRGLIGDEDLKSVFGCNSAEHALLHADLAAAGRRWKWPTDEPRKRLVLQEADIILSISDTLFHFAAMACIKRASLQVPLLSLVSWSSSPEGYSTVPVVASASSSWFEQVFAGYSLGIRGRRAPGGITGSGRYQAHRHRWGYRGVRYGVQYGTRTRIVRDKHTYRSPTDT